MSYDLDFVTKGVLLEGNADKLIENASRAIERAIADEAQRQVVSDLHVVIRNPTPVYWTKVVVKRRSGILKVTDQGMIYGPWLEGTSDRNSTTRFRGYSTFRRKTRTIQALAPRIADGVLKKYVRRL